MTARPRRRWVVTIAFPLACLVLTIATYAAFGGAMPFAPRGYRVHVPLPDAQNVVEGSDVRTAGVKIGKVVSVERDGDRAVATVEVQPRYVPLRSAATAIVRTKTLLGEGYIELAPGAPAAPPVPEGGTLDARRVRSPVKLDEFLETFSPEMRRSTRSLFAGLARAFEHRGDALSDTLATTAPLSSDLAGVLRTANAQSAELRRFVLDSSSVFDALGRRSAAVRGFISSGDDVLAATARRDRRLAATLRALPPFLRELRATSRVVRAASPDLNRAAAGAESLAAPLDRTLARVQRTGPDLRALFERLPATVSAGRRGLPATARIVDAVPSALRTTYPALRELIPFMQLLEQYREPGLVAPLATAGAAANGKIVGPGGKILTRAGGLTYVANESIGGWKKRLPTDRSNPYPKPDALLEVSRKGFLSSFDCRNVHNPAYLPPTGTGVPPCVTQGPWTFRGKEAYFPRLQRDPP